jgi:hypothetical protein
VFNFHDVPQCTIQGTAPLDVLFAAEVFLAQDTGIKDAAGKAVVKVCGGNRCAEAGGPPAWVG